MKNYQKILTSTLIFIFITVTGVNPSAVSNTPPNVKLDGNASGIVYIPEDEPFLMKNNMLPGDRITRTLEIENNYNVPYKLYLRAERVSPEDDQNLLDNLNLVITYNEEVIYDGNATGQDGLSSDIDLGVYKPGERGKLVANVVLDGPSTGNEYKNKHLYVNWVFTAINTQKDEDKNWNLDKNEDNDGLVQGKPERTSDSYNVKLYTLVFIVSGLLLFIIYIIANKRGKKW
ncbi:hypothetical protein [Clostridium sp. LP20]|uniref:hypothetical protein n=1 Tax=Clostridium sp. LP20 TaxID=3418665 RepID=UPI003EE63F2D